MIEFTIYIEPIGQARPRFSAVSGHVRAYESAKARGYKNQLITLAIDHKPQKPLAGEVGIEVVFYMPIPKSFAKNKRSACELGMIRPTTKPDLDNMLKAVMDAFSGHFWMDDKQVVSSREQKFYGEEPRIQIKIYEVPV